MTAELLDPPTETKLQKIEEPENPSQIWALRITGDDDKSSGRLVRSTDDEAAWLAYSNEDDAKEMARYHADWWGIECEPVRLK